MRKYLREMSTAEKSFLHEVEQYDRVLDVTALVSLRQRGIETDGRGIRASRIFVRQTQTALSLSKILPRPSASEPQDGTLWDISSVASLSRNLVEGYLSLYYFGLEEVSAVEAELRFFLLQLHKNVEWYEIRKKTDPADPTLKTFEEGIPKEKARIREHPYLGALTDVQRRRALRGLEMYKTRADFEDELPVCRNLRRNYRLLSNLVHPLPLSVERIDDDRGRGTGSDVDVSYCLLCLVLARSYLAASTVGFAEHFPEHLARKFGREVEEIRPLALRDPEAG